MVEQPKIAERFHQAVEETSSLRKRSPLFYILFVAVILTVGFDVYVRYGKIPRLEKEKDGLMTMVRNLKKHNSDLQITVEEKENEVFRLETLLNPFEAAALQRYPGAPEEALDKLGDDLDKETGIPHDLEKTNSQQKSELGRLKRNAAKQKKEIASLKGQITKLEQEKVEQAAEISMLSAMGEYVDVATWDMDGMATLWDSQEVKTPVSNWAKNYRHQRGMAESQWDCGSAALYHYREVMDQYPKYPFTYYVLAKCLHDKGEPAWEEYAKTGISILKKTTRLSGHASDHDDALIELSALLEATKR